MPRLLREILVKLKNICDHCCKLATRKHAISFCLLVQQKHDVLEHESLPKIMPTSVFALPLHPHCTPLRPLCCIPMLALPRVAVLSEMSSINRCVSVSS